MKASRVFALIMGMFLAASLISAANINNNIQPVNSGNEHIVLTATQLVKGDINSDSKASMDDVNFLISYIYKEGNAPNPVSLADFNKDSKVSMLDVTALIAYLKENGLLDSEKPVIELINPDDGDEFTTSKSEKNIVFEFIVDDESALDYCELIINDHVYERIEDPEKGVILKITEELDRDDYDWKVRCADVFGNIGVSETWDFEINKKTSEPEPAPQPAPAPQTTPSYDFTQDSQEVITVNQPKSQLKFNWLGGYIIPILLALCIIPLLIMVLILRNRY